MECSKLETFRITARCLGLHLYDPDEPENVTACAVDPAHRQPCRPSPARARARHGGTVFSQRALRQATAPYSVGLGRLSGGTSPGAGRSRSSRCRVVAACSLPSTVVRSASDVFRLLRSW